ncbi:MAG: hypothetical protein WCJ29_01470 [bacterium]
MSHDCDGGFSEEFEKRVEARRQEALKKQILEKAITIVIGRGSFARLWREERIPEQARCEFQPFTITVDANVRVTFAGRLVFDSGRFGIGDELEGLVCDPQVFIPGEWEKIFDGLFEQAKPVAQSVQNAHREVLRQKEKGERDEREREEAKKWGL